MAALPRLVMLSGDPAPVEAIAGERVSELRSRLANALGVAKGRVCLAAGPAELSNEQDFRSVAASVVQVILRVHERALYVADSGLGGRVTRWPLEFDEGGAGVELVAGGRKMGSDLEQLNNPRDVVVDSHRKIYVTESGSDRVTCWASHGAARGEKVVGGSGSGASLCQLNTPNSICFDREGFLYVCEFWNHRVTRWAPGEERGEVVAGGRGQGEELDQLNGPSGICLDGDGAVYVADFTNARVVRWAPGVDQGEIVAGGRGLGNELENLSGPAGVFVDESGRLYVAEKWNQRVTRWIPGAKSGEIVAGGHGRGPKLNQLWYPIAVFVDDLGMLYVSEERNDRVSRWAPGAEFCEVIAGGVGCGDGPGQLSHPSGIYVT